MNELTPRYANFSASHHEPHWRHSSICKQGSWSSGFKIRPDVLYEVKAFLVWKETVSRVSAESMASPWTASEQGGGLVSRLTVPFQHLSAARLCGGSSASSRGTRLTLPKAASRAECGKSFSKYHGCQTHVLPLPSVQQSFLQVPEDPRSQEPIC